MDSAAQPPQLPSSAQEPAADPTASGGGPPSNEFGSGISSPDGSVTLPGDRARSAAGQTPAAAPKAPGLGELFELSLTALVDAPGVFSRLAARPCPGLASCLLVATAWGATFIGLNVIHVALSSPAALRVASPALNAVMFAAGLGLWAALALLGSGLLYALGRGLGHDRALGEEVPPPHAVGSAAAGDLDRAALIAAIALAAAPLQGLCNWFPVVWLLPIPLAAWVAAWGLMSLFGAGVWPARACCAMLAAAALGAEYAASLAVERFQRAAQSATAALQSPQATEQLARQLRQWQVAPDAPSADPTASGGGTRSPASEAPGADTNARPGSSGLDLLRGPAQEPPPAPPPAAAAARQVMGAADNVNASVVGLLDSLAPMLDDPAVLKTLTPRQRADYAEIKRLLAEAREEMRGAKTADPRSQRERMSRLQALSLRMLEEVDPAPRAARSAR